MAKLQFRYNVMEINSIEAFLGIKGGFNNGIRDVYFVRGIGEPKNLLEIVRDIDKKMDIEMADGKLKYVRINELPQLKDVKDADYYSAIYAKWVEGEICEIKTITPSEKMKEVLNDALHKTISEYKLTRDNVTTSMVRNFAIKILFWLDHGVGDLLSAWNERSCVKVIADNVIKEQEFLFYFFLTHIGCDVFLLQNRGDLISNSQMLDYSRKIVLGKEGELELPQYVKHIPEKKKVSVQQKNNSIAADSSHKNTVVIPERPSRSRTNAINNSTQVTAIKQQRSGSSEVQPIDSRIKVIHEKSFEELALLASSVVLISIHDSDGDIIGTGSGIMIGRNGYILTNNHVASGGRFYSVRIEDDEEVYVTNEVIKYNVITDLAVIRIKRQLKPIPIYKGGKRLVRGQKVVAIGSPLGLFNSVSDGIISGFRNIHDVDMIQFTAPISHGSSGGAVLNMQGEVIGISTAGIDSGQNINLAIGYESIRMFANGFID